MNDCEMVLAGKGASAGGETVPTVPGWVGPVKPHPDMPAGLALGPVPMTRERHFGGSWLVLAGHKRTGGSSVFSFVPPGNSPEKDEVQSETEPEECPEPKAREDWGDVEFGLD
ncbi:hypothetical protein J1605_006847 [Eschrichtius robustus]|uniref:Uncharacterized protein n=1 Tax=Eschrichtius robustus TaxID=9764 RepID=A0AB34H3W8_ESCRO|nr:hypothetical protein J1605_006847 [Eschrichtius robustus]